MTNKTKTFETIDPKALASATGGTAGWTWANKQSNWSSWQQPATWSK